MLADQKHALTLMQEPERIRMKGYRRKVYSLRQWPADANIPAPHRAQASPPQGRA